MTRLQSIICLPLVVGAIMLGISGCASKGLQSGGDTRSGKSAKSAQSAQSAQQDGKVGLGQDSPDTSFSGEDSSRGLRGLDKNPAEERLGGNALTSKSDPNSAARQMGEIRAEQAAAAAAGLRDVFFAFDSFMISGEGRQALLRNAEWLKSNPGAQLKIEGHCDERGTSAYNLVLGEKRAKSEWLPTSCR
jgi:peptidoglycan-associated lipoprotein